MEPVAFSRPVKFRLHEYASDPTLTNYERTFLQQQFQLFSVRQYSNRNASLNAYAYQVPFRNNESKGGSGPCPSLLAVTGKNCLDFLAYRFRMPNGKNPSSGDWVITMDYETGFVRASPVFKCLGYNKGVPTQAMSKTPGFHEVCASLTGGKVESQGFWLPHDCAYELFRRIAGDIKAVLYPLFGRRVLTSCLPAPRDTKEMERQCKLDPSTIITTASNLPIGNTVDVDAIRAKATSTPLSNMIFGRSQSSPGSSTDSDVSTIGDSPYDTLASTGVSPKTRLYSLRGRKAHVGRRDSPFSLLDDTPSPTRALPSEDSSTTTEGRSKRKVGPRSIQDSSLLGEKQTLKKKPTLKRSFPSPSASGEGSTDADTEESSGSSKPSKSRRTGKANLTKFRRGAITLDVPPIIITDPSQRHTFPPRLRGADAFAHNRLLHPHEVPIERRRDAAEDWGAQLRLAQQQQYKQQCEDDEESLYDVGEEVEDEEDEDEDDEAGGSDPTTAVSALELRAAVGLLMLADTGSAAKWSALSAQDVDRAIDHVRAEGRLSRQLPGH